MTPLYADNSCDKSNRKVSMTFPVKSDGWQKNINVDAIRFESQVPYYYTNSRHLFLFSWEVPSL